MAPRRKREEELQRPRSRQGNRGQASQAEVTVGELRPVNIPRASSEWGGRAKALFNSFRTSGQSEYFQNSDWQLIWIVCDEYDTYSKSNKRSAMMFDAILKATERLLTTEADRRKARMELRHPEPVVEPVSLVAINSYKDALAKGAPKPSED